MSGRQCTVRSENPLGEVSAQTLPDGRAKNGLASRWTSRACPGLQNCRIEWSKSIYVHISSLISKHCISQQFQIGACWVLYSHFQYLKAIP